MWSPCGSDRISRMLVEEPCGHLMGLTGLVLYSVFFFAGILR